ncbi:MAG: potassium channel family protein [Candidatus Falkowbacteria bacterium]|nr:potassium channel family protein [Candidatus Falkowbacteria bacterium]
MLKNIFKFFSSILRGLKDHEFRSLLFFVIIVLLIGTFSYHRLEGWNFLDSFYFSSITLTTVGYGDLAPHTDAGKIFTVIYIFLGIGVILGFLAAVASKAREKD